MANVEKSIEMTSMENNTPGFKYGWPEEKYQKWMKDLEKRKEKHPFEERRIGWISEIPDYHVCCMGQSVKDWFLILAFFVVFYAVNVLIIWGLWSLTSINVVVLSYLYGFIGFVLIILLLVGMTIRGKSLENAYLESLADDNSFVFYKQTLQKESSFYSQIHKYYP